MVANNHDYESMFWLIWGKRILSRAMSHNTKTMRVNRKNVILSGENHAMEYRESKGGVVHREATDKRLL